MPLLVNYSQSNGINPIGLFGFLGIIIAVIITRMRETFGLEMPNYIKETIENVDDD